MKTLLRGESEWDDRPDGNWRGCFRHDRKGLFCGYGTCLICLMVNPPLTHNVHSAIF